LKGVNMNRIISRIGAAVVAVVMMASGFGTATAAPIAAQRAQVTSSVELAQYRDERRYTPRDRRFNGRHDRQDRYRAENRRDRRGYWNGHRGYREYRRGYRRHSDGYYYAPSVFKLFIR
jgi:type IV secretory pathway protease TraF